MVTTESALWRRESGLVHAVIAGHVGPSHRRDPTYSSPSSSDAEEEEPVVVMKKGKRARQLSPKMKPRKLFKSGKRHSKADPPAGINMPNRVVK